MKPLVGGQSNTIVKCWLNNEDEAVLVKIYGRGSDLLIDRRQELESMELLSRAGLGAEVMASFHNGLVYTFVTGEPLTKELVRKEDVALMIAARMAKMHALPLDKKSGDVLWPRLSKFINILPDDWTLEKDSKRSLILEYEGLKSELEDCHSDLVFCHNDLNIPNIIYNGSDVTFIDVEYSGCSYAAFDIANHFVEFVGFEENILEYERWYPDKKFQLSWLRKYFAVFTENISEAQIESTYQLVQQFVLCSHLMWGAWSLVQSQVSKINFNFKDFAHQRFLEYA